MTHASSARDAVRWATTVAILVTLATAQPVHGQRLAPSDPFADRARLLELTNRDPWTEYRPARADSVGVSGFRLLPLEARTYWNSARPWGWNDGAVWQGRGATLAVSGGVSARWGKFSAQLRPMAIRNENKGFALSPLAAPTGLSPFAYPTGLGTSIDMPQRFGDGGFTTFDLGQSYVQVEAGPVAFGLSNENRWWGPGRQNAITMTDHAPGFGHAFLSTPRPVNVRIGTLHAEWTWGRLRESGYFDDDPENDSRFHTGIELAFTPRGVPGLQLGATRAFVSAWHEGGPSLGEALVVFVPLGKKSFISPSNPAGDDESDQIASLFFRWAMPGAGFEFYGEWGRGDHSWDLRDFLIEPEHASAFVLGFQKVFEGASSAEPTWRFGTEVALLGATRTSLVRAPASAFYVHHLIRQGYTQRGQVLGAGIGPGSSQLYAGLDRFARWGKLGFGLRRTVYDNNRFYGGTPLYYTHEAEPTVMADLLLFRGPWDLSASLAASRLLNKHYVDRNDETNLNLGLGARFHFGPR